MIGRLHAVVGDAVPDFEDVRLGQRRAGDAARLRFGRFGGAARPRLALGLGSIPGLTPANVQAATHFGSERFQHCSTDAVVFVHQAQGFTYDLAGRAAKTGFDKRRFVA